MLILVLPVVPPLGPPVNLDPGYSCGSSQWFLLWFPSVLPFSGPRPALSAVASRAEGGMFSALAAAREAAAALQLPGQANSWRAAVPEFLTSHLWHPHHQCKCLNTQWAQVIQETDWWLCSASGGCRKCCRCRRRLHERSAPSYATTVSRSNVRRWWSDSSKVRISLLLLVLLVLLVLRAAEQRSS